MVEEDFPLNCRCGRRYETSEMESSPCPFHQICGGPGTELTEMLKEIDAKATKSCNCAARAAQMDAWGALGCREHRDGIIEWMKEAYQSL